MLSGALIVIPTARTSPAPSTAAAQPSSVGLTPVPLIPLRHSSAPSLALNLITVKSDKATPLVCSVPTAIAFPAASRVTEFRSSCGHGEKSHPWPSIWRRQSSLPVEPEIFVTRKSWPVEPLLVFPAARTSPAPSRTTDFARPEGMVRRQISPPDAPDNLATAKSKLLPLSMCPAATTLPAASVVTEYASSLPFAVPLRLLCQARDSCGERTRAHADTAKMSAATLAIRS